MADFRQFLSKKDKLHFLKSGAYRVAPEAEHSPKPSAGRILVFSESVSAWLSTVSQYLAQHRQSNSYQINRRATFGVNVSSSQTLPVVTLRTHKSCRDTPVWLCAPVLWREMARGSILAVPLASCVFLGKLLNLSVPSFLLYKMCNYLIKVSLLHAKHWAQSAGSAEMLAAMRQMIMRMTHVASGKTCSTEPRWGHAVNVKGALGRFSFHVSHRPDRSPSVPGSVWSGGSMSGSWCGLSSPEWSVGLRPSH